MAEFRISMNLSPLDVRTAVNRQVFTLLSQAVRAVMVQTTANWIEAVQRARLWSGEKDQYANSIRGEMTGDLTAMVWTDYKLAEEIENGRPAKDLKRMLDTSMKVRVSAKGKRYLIIPFRHNTPGNDAHAPAMPKSVFLAARALQPSRIIGQTTRLSGTGAYDLKTRAPATVKQNRYSWGDSLVSEALHGVKNAKRYEGMYRFETTTPGGKRSSAYLTFRAMVEGSPKWIVAPRPGLHIAEQVTTAMQPLAERAMQEAIKRSL